MSSINHPRSADMLTTGAMLAFVTADHDEGLCHGHRWARDAAAERRSFPRVAQAALVGTPSTTIHDDIHYAG